MKEMLRNGYTHAEAAEKLGLVYDNMGRLFKKPPMVVDAAKTAYVSPPHGALDITIIRDAQPRVTISLDLGIPNFTVFSMNLPLAEASRRRCPN